MKTPETVISDVRRRLAGKWHAHISGDAHAFPHSFPIGRPSAAELQADYASAHARTVEWQDWATTQDVRLEYENRAARGGTLQVVPTHLHVETIDSASTIAGGDWPERIVRARERLPVLRAGSPEIDHIGRVLRLVDGYSATDFELLLTVSSWYLDDPARAVLGVTPRQVPIPGVHAKWLQSHRAGVQALTGLDELGILPRHPARIHFTYLDPDHRASGARFHDSATVGDAFAPAYRPQIVVISENKDTAIHFPPLVGGVSIEGVGKGGKTAASFPWIRDAPIVIYWGDIDRDGYEILDGYRAAFDRDIDSILMDSATYEAFEAFGTNLDQHGKALTDGDVRGVDWLRPHEKAVYLNILDARHRRHRRIEQERIPLARAVEEVEAVCRADEL